MRAAGADEFATQVGRDLVNHHDGAEQEHEDRSCFVACALTPADRAAELLADAIGSPK